MSKETCIFSPAGATPCADDHRIPQEDNETTVVLSAVCVQFILWQDPHQNGIELVTTDCGDLKITSIKHTATGRSAMWAVKLKIANLVYSKMLHLRITCGIQIIIKKASVGLLCVSGSHTFVPFSWMCETQPAVSRSNAESKIMSLDAGLRMDGSPALQFWERVLGKLSCETAERNLQRHKRNKIIPSQSFSDACVFESIEFTIQSREFFKS